MRSDTLGTFRACLSRLTGISEGAESSAEVDLALGLLETAPLIVLVLDGDTRIRYVNPYFEELSGYRLADVEGRNWFDLCIPDADHEPIRAVFADAIAGQATRGNLNAFQAADGVLYDVEWFDRTIKDVDGKVVGLLTIGRNVSARTSALRQLQELNDELEQRVEARTEELLERSQLLEGSFDASTVALAYLDPQMRFLRVNRAYAAADNREPEYFVGKNHFDLYPNEDNERLFSMVRDTGNPHSVLAKPFEYAANPERGVTHWDWTLTPVKDKSGAVQGLVLALRDVTARIEAIEAVKSSEAELQRQLEVKDVLLHEIHHRVKNNLQVISSLLYLQGQRADGEELSELLQESRRRVQAMALVHETIYSSERIELVDFGDYLERLVGAIRISFGKEVEAVEYEIDTAGLALRLETSLSCGLICCELVTNAFKYAFKGRDEGRLSISLGTIDEGRLRLEVRDDGPGICRSESTCHQSLGLTLVRATAQQLQGSFELESRGGTIARVEFPYTP